MHFPDRIYGLEHEYGVMDFAAGVFQKHSQTTAEMKIEFMARAIPGSLMSDTQGLRMWHPNGSCSYIDTGDHPEHATAECRTVRDAVLHSKAGDVLMNRIFSQKNISPCTLHLFKNNIGYGEGLKYVSFGCHENYLATYAPDLAHTLAPLLITRQILDGAGWWEKGASKIPVYLFSQRAMVMENPISSGTIQNRGLLVSRETTDTGPAPRLHLICGDSNILEFAAYLKLGTTSLVLSLIEGKKVPNVPCLNLVETMQQIAESGDPFLRCIHSTPGDEQSPFDVQTIYLEAAQRELAHGSFDSEETEAELKHIAMSWEQALNAIYNRDTQWMWGRLDYATKEYLADQGVARKNISDPAQIFSVRKDVDIAYHDITNPILHSRMNARWADRRIVTDKEIEWAVVNPPPRTRAQLRSRFISYVHRYKIREKVLLRWERCGFVRRHFGLQDTFCMNDPLAYDTKGLDDYLYLSRIGAIKPLPSP